MITPRYIDILNVLLKDHTVYVGSRDNSTPKICQIRQSPLVGAVSSMIINACNSKKNSWCLAKNKKWTQLRYTTLTHVCSGDSGSEDWCICSVYGKDAGDWSYDRDFTRMDKCNAFYWLSKEFCILSKSWMPWRSQTQNIETVIRPDY